MSLESDLEVLLNDVHVNTWRQFQSVKANASQVWGLKANLAKTWKTPGEPAFVSELLSTQALYELRRLIVSDPSFSHFTGKPIVSGCFIHQKPKVAYGPVANPVEIELGDLLLVRHHFTFGQAVPQGRAFLLQAKAANTPRTGKLSADEIEQFDLYDGWTKKFIFPTGEIAKPGLPTDWDFSGGSQIPVDQTGIYGVVFNDQLPFKAGRKTRSAFRNGCIWGIGSRDAGDFSSAPKSVEASNRSLGESLAKFIRGSFGRTWTSATPLPGDDWSLFIQKMLANAVDWEYPIQRLEKIGEKRLKRLLAFKTLAPVIPYAITHAFRSSFYDSDKAPFRTFIKWADSLESVGSPDVPRKKPDDKPFPRGGMSTLYIATFGDSSLPNPE